MFGLIAIIGILAAFIVVVTHRMINLFLSERKLLRKISKEYLQLRVEHHDAMCELTAYRQARQTLMQMMNARGELHKDVNVFNPDRGMN